jgi:tetratricopeptide (TPR) repeat protein
VKPRDLDADLKLLETVRAHAQARDFARAAAIANRALAEGFEHPLLLNVAATHLEQQGRFAEALKLLERAVELAPGDAPARHALGLCLQRLERPAEALTHVEALLRLQPNLAVAHVSKGNALIALGALGRARESHRRALELEPGNLAAAAALASIATHRGEHAEARLWAQRALSAAPGFPDAVLSLAAADLHDGAHERAETALRALLADPRAGAIDRARACGLLGDVLDAAGRYAGAFEAYAACNELLRQIHRRHDRGMLAYGEALLAAEAAAGTARWAGAEAPAAPVREHVFLIGFPRSGTTLLEVVLDGHPEVASLEEHELLVDGVLHFLGEPLDLGRLARADEAELAPLRAGYWRRAQASGVGLAGKVFIDKHPLHTLKLPLIARLFPQAKILFAERDPRDVVLSCFRRRFRMNPAMYELLTLPGAAALYDLTLRFATAVEPRLGLALRRVRYETLVGDLEGETRAICAFLGLEAGTGLVDFASRAREREHATPSTAQLSRGLDRSGIGHWRHYVDALRPVLPRLAPWVARLGYEA